MISRYEAYMDNTALSSLDPSIYVLNIRDAENTPTYITTQNASGHGARINKKYFNKTGVEIDFEIHEYDTVKRRNVLSKINRWADGKILTVSDRPFQQLRCVCEKYPTMTAREWTEMLTVAFSGYNPPFWEDDTETVVTMASSSGTIIVPGDAPYARLSAEITSQTVQTVSVELAAAGRSMIISDVPMAANSTLKLDYDDNGIQRIHIGNTSYLDKRTGVDELTAECGKITSLAYSSSQTLSVKFKARGAWK